MALNIFLIIVIVVAAAILIAIYLIKNKKDAIDEEDFELEKFSLKEMLHYIQEQTNAATNVNPFNLGLSKEDFERQKRRITSLKDALKKCNTGDINNKNYVKEFIYELLASYGLNEHNIDYVLPFHQANQLDSRTKFEILMYHYEKEHKTRALDVFIQEYKLDEPREDAGFRITEEDIEKIFIAEQYRPLTFEDKLWIITQRLYSIYKGFGVIDQIRDYKIDGVSGGVSGMPERLENEDDEEILMNAMHTKPDTYNSVWIMYRGKTLHLEFLSFENENEIRRVTQNIYKYNYPGQLSESKPYIINEMADGSRVVVVRPKLAESWAFFIRKFSNSSMTIDQLITHDNKELAIKTIEYLIRGQRITALTGAQGSGKTTLLMQLIGFIHPALTLRLQETAFELNLRKLYPKRNILSFQETHSVTGQEGLDLQKKTDGSVNIIGEVATDSVAAWMIQSAQVASLFTLFTHHAKTARDLVYALRNSLLKTGTFSNEKIAEQQVVSVLEFNIHLQMGYDGKRHIERITEIIPVTENNFEEELRAISVNSSSTEKDAMVALAQAAIPYFKQGVQQRQFREQNIVEYQDGKYVAVHPISQMRIDSMYHKMPEEIRDAFLIFTKERWRA